MEIDQAVLAEILRQELQLWVNTREQFKIRYEVAEHIKNEPMKTEAQAKIEEAVTAIKYLEEKQTVATKHTRD